MCPIPVQPRDMRGLEAPPDGITPEACFDPIVESSDPEKADDEEAGSEQPHTRTDKALHYERGAEAYENNAHTAYGTPTAQEV